MKGLLSVMIFKNDQIHSPQILFNDIAHREGGKGIGAMTIVLTFVAVDGIHQ
jgi:hypothetical protein